MTRTRLFGILMALLLCAFGMLPASDATQTTIRHYDYPSSDKDARDACIQQEADARGIPLQPVAYRAWFTTNQHTPEYGSWRAAVQHCQDTTVWRTGKWNWSSRILVGES